MRLRIDLAYDGADFHGWAAQPGLRTVQAELETALATVLRMPQVSSVCAGRTDTGVHARGQVVHLDVADDALVASAGRSGADPAGALARRLNGVLPPDLRVRRVVTAAEGFDARFSPAVAPLRLPGHRRCPRPADARLRARLAATPRR